MSPALPATLPYHRPRLQSRCDTALSSLRTMPVSKRHSPAVPAQASDIKHRVFTCLSKLSDRDTQSLAVAELESIAAGLSPAAVPAFVSWLHASDVGSTKSPVRTHCVHLLVFLSHHHRDALAPSAPKMVAAVLRRLRDPDSAVRSACVDAVTAMASKIPAAPFSAVFLKPLSAAVFTEQDYNAQLGSALCLAAAIDAAPDPEPAQLLKLVPKLVKLLRSQNFKAKPALLTLVASLIEAGGASSCAALRNLVPCMVELVSSEDWAARKAAAEALARLAVAERDALSQFKPSCVMTFEKRRYDKVKVVRDTINHMVEVWRAIPDVPDQMSPPPHSLSSSQETISDGQFPPLDSQTPHSKMKHIIATSLSPFSSSYVPKTKKTTTLPVQPHSDKPLGWNIEISVPHGSYSTEICKSSGGVVEKGKFESWPSMSENKSCGFKSGSCVPCYDENTESTSVVSNKTEDLHKSVKESEELSLIRKHLVQIENQQSCLLDLFQRFIKSSENGMRSLETRVHGLELGLDEISFDLAVSTGRMLHASPSGTSCCTLPGAEFLRSRLWRRPAGQHSSARFSSFHGNTPMAGSYGVADRNGSFETFWPQNRRVQLHRGAGFIKNPLTENHNNLVGLSDISPEKVPKNAHTVGT